MFAPAAWIEFWDMSRVVREEWRVDWLTGLDMAIFDQLFSGKNVGESCGGGKGECVRYGGEG